MADTLHVRFHSLEARPMQCSNGHEWMEDRGPIELPFYSPHGERLCPHCLKEFLAQHLGVVTEVK